MTSNLEMDHLSQRKLSHTPEDPSGPNTANSNQTGEDATPSTSENAITMWAYGSTILLVALAAPMILFPKVLLFAAETGPSTRTALTPLEALLALHGGIILFALAMGLLFNIPSGRPIAQAAAGTKVTGHPLLVPLTTACTTIAFLSYNTISVSSLAFLVFLGSATIGVWGIWTILFAGSSNISKKTGADKHTSRFLFGNKSSASVQKKRWKEEQARKVT